MTFVRLGRKARFDLVISATPNQVLMARDVYEYFHQFESRCKALGLVAECDLSDACSALEGSDGKRGRIFRARFALTERTSIVISEKIVMAKSSAHREEYAYYLIFAGEDIYARDRD